MTATAPAQTITHTYHLTVWAEMNRIPVGNPKYHTLIVTGERGGRATEYAYVIDGKPATATEAYTVMRRAQSTGICELVSEVTL